MKFQSRSISLLCALFVGLGSLLQAEETFESLVHKLADDSYAVRTASVEALAKMCRDKPKLIEHMAPVILDEEGDIERILNAREVVYQSIDEIRKLNCQEPGFIGIRLTKTLMVRSVTVGAPGEKSGISHSIYLVSIAGKSMKGKTPDDIDTLIQATKPGTKLEMKFVNKAGEKFTFYPIVGQRSIAMNPKVTEARCKKIYNEWLERMRKELEK